jgi:L-ascorbate metabolism protein UlaG (beta-lactamase superfamily)
VTGTLTWIGNATALIEYGGFTLLTDPNFLHKGQRAYLGKGVVSTRRHDPAMRLEDLPRLDAVVLSHLHADHFNRVARAGLPKHTPIVTTRAAARTLRRWGFSNAVALDTWQSHELRSTAGDVVRITAAPGRHAPGPLAPLLPPVNGTVLEYTPVDDDALSVYITGDTLLVDALREVPARHPSLDLGLWHLGGTRIPGVLGLGVLVTMDGEQGAQLLQLVRPRTTVPIHFDDYGVFHSPLSEFLDEVERRGLTGVRPLARGESLLLPPP